MRGSDICCETGVCKVFDKIDREGLWTVLRLSGLNGRLLKRVKSFYVNSRACVRVGNGVSDWFD